MTRRKDGRWQTVMTIGGKKRYFYSSADTEKAAERDIRRQIAEFKDETSTRTDFSSVAEKWASDAFEDVENNTLKSYRPSLASVKDFFGDMSIEKIESTDINEYLRDLKNKGYAKKTVRNRFSVLRMIFVYAKTEMKVIKYNPCSEVKIPKNLKTTPRPWIKDEEMRAIKNGMGESDECFFAAFLLFTGLRKGEAYALDFDEDIDYTAHAVKVSKTVEWIGNIPQIKNCPKTDAGNRTVPIPKVIFGELVKRRRKGLIFPNKYGELIHDTQTQKMARDFRAQLGINVTPHQIRYGYATLLYDANIDVKTASMWMGHSDIRTTLNIYTQLSEMRSADQKNKFDEYTSTSEFWSESMSKECQNAKDA